MGQPRKARPCSRARQLGPAVPASSYPHLATPQPHTHHGATPPPHLTCIHTIMHLVHAATQALEAWYPTPEAGNNKGVLLMVTTSKEGAVTGGAAFTKAIGDDLIESIVTDNIPIYAEQEKYNGAILSAVDRLEAKITNKTVPGACVGGRVCSCVCARACVFWGGGRSKGGGGRGCPGAGRDEGCAGGRRGRQGKPRGKEKGAAAGRAQRNAARMREVGG